MIRPLLFPCMILLFIIKITGADYDSSVCDGFLLDSNCYIVIMADNVIDESSSSFSFSYDSSLNIVEISWEDAKDLCEENGTNLASIPNINVQYSLAAYLKLVHPETSLFIGLRRKGNEYIWRWDDTGKATQYTNWNTRRMQPTIKNTTCAGVHMDTYDGLWYDARCNSIPQFKELRTGALCQYKIRSKITSAPANTPLQGNGSGTSDPLNTPLQCNEYGYIVVIIAQSIVIIALLITLILYCKKRKCTATGEYQTKRNEHSSASKMTGRNRAASGSPSTNTYDVPRNDVPVPTEDAYEMYDQPPRAGHKHNNPTYDMTAMDENNYMQPTPTQPEYMELDVNH